MTYDLHPSRGLLHPVWLASLGVLALNDHLLKGADLLPGAVTGKLSDVAGMLVAPLLLAAVLRVRRFGAWVACHLAVGAVFAAIQVWPAAAEGWSAAMGALGFPWTITADPTDLLVLPVLALSLWGLAPALRRPAVANARRTAECGAASVGLLCCVATSSREEPREPWPDTDGFEDTDEPWGQLPDIEADLYLSNATPDTQVVRVRALRSDVLLDCEAVAEDPGGLLRSSLFDPAQAWTLPPDANIPVSAHTPGERTCYAAWIEADALPAVVALWSDGDPPMTIVPGQGQQGLPGELILRGSIEALTLEGAPGRLHPSSPIEPEAAGTCATQPDGDRFAWSTPVPWGPAQITAVQVGVDGCLAIDLARGSDQDETWYLCLPSSSFPFAPGDTVDLRLGSPAVDDAGPADIIEIVALDEASVAQPLPNLVVSVGAGLPSVGGLELHTLPLYSCELGSEPECGTVERPLSLVVGGDTLTAAELQVGDGPVPLDGGDRRLLVTLGHAQQRFVLDPQCALGPAALGPDLELAIAQWPALEG